MIHLSQLHKLVENDEFSMKFVKEDGSIVVIDRCVCSSWYSRGRTMNIKLLPSNQTRKINRCTITEFNGEEVFL